jgi:hypothetical protein
LRERHLQNREKGLDALEVGGSAIKEAVERARAAEDMVLNA